MLDPVRPGQQGAVDGSGKVCGGKEQDISMLAGQQIDTGESRVGRSMHVDRIGFETHALSVRRERLDLVQEDDARAVGGMFGNHLVEELGNFLLTPPQGGTGQGVRVDLNEVHLGADESGGNGTGQAPRQRGLACPGRSGQDDQPVNGHRLEGKVLA